MKKKLLLLTLLCSTLLVSAQAQQGTDQRVPAGKYRGKYSAANVISPSGQFRKGGMPPSTAGFTLFLEDFASGFPSTWALEDSIGGGEVWKWTDVGSANSPAGAGVRDSLSSINTSAANGYMIFDSDSGGSSSGPEVSSIVTPAINCTGYSTLLLSFNEYFLQYAIGEGIVDVSNDSINWTRIYNAELGLSQNTATPNPNSVTLDISAVAGNQSTVYVRFKWRGDWDYYWMIDDVRIFEPSAVEASLENISGVTSGCNLSSATPVTVEIRNFGGTALSNAPVFMSVNGGTPISGIVPGPIAPLGTTTFTFPTTIDLSAAGIYDVLAWCAVTGDSNAVNDTAAIQIESFVANTLASPYTMDFEAGEFLGDWSVEDANQDGVSWALINTLAFSGTLCLRKAGSGDYDDDWVWTGCFDLQAGTNYTLDYWFRQFDLTAPCSLEVKLATAPDVASSTQLIATEGISDVYINSVNTFTVPANGTYHLAFHAFLPDTLPTAGSSSLRIDFINLSVATGINENQNPGGVSVFPNPNNGIFDLRIMKSGPANIRIYNATGKEVFFGRTSDMHTRIDLSEQSKGLYVVTVEGDGFTYNQKITVQ